MKNSYLKLLFGLSVLYSIGLNGQLLTENSMWKIVERTEYINYPFPTYSSSSYNLNGSKIVNGRSCKVLTYSVSDTVGFLWEEGDKVFFKYSGNRFDYDTTAFLLYDFGLALGDTVPLRFESSLIMEYGYWRFTVVDIDSVSTVSGRHRRIRLTSIDKDSTYPSGYPLDFIYWNCYGDTMDWIEGIGCPIGLLYSYDAAYCEGLGERWERELVCHMKGDSAWYMPYGTCTPNFSLSQVKVQPDIKIYPVPASDYIKYDSYLPVRKIEIFNTRGQSMKSIESPGERIDIANMPDGIYFLRITGWDGIEYSEKINVVNR